MTMHQDDFDPRPAAPRLPVILITCLVLILVALVSAAVLIVKYRAAQQLTQRDYSGYWIGSWDGIWEVRFTVPKEGQPLEVIYEWQEQRNGRFYRDVIPAQMSNGVLKIGSNMELRRSWFDANQASAVGHFKSPRTARMTRVNAP